MFYFFLAPIMSYNYILLIAAVIPAALLMLKAYRSDRLEKESPALLWRLFLAGVFSSLIALVLERIGWAILDRTVSESDPRYNVILYFGIVALSEEGAKYFLLNRRTWKSPEFNCQYDGVVYALFVSLGFALWENISYVLQYGFTTAIVRALTAIPGHACFGIFMGIFYGLARRDANLQPPKAAVLWRVLALVVPALLHGAYDYIASMESTGSGWYFFAFVAALFVVSYILIHHASRRDRYIA
ncbi:MAG: PrsW family intramembrane metalloprotease [Clostridia bacterium]|nr:PrsW family intramembrane metalloprotease [Clostridia bacterium]